MPEAYSGGVEGCLRQLLVDELLGRFAATATACTNAKFPLEVRQLMGALINRVDDLRVGYGFAETDVHGVI